MRIELDGRRLRAPGDHALLGDIVVRIVTTNIHPRGHLGYKVAWTLDGRHEEWVEEWELMDAGLGQGATGSGSGRPAPDPPSTG